MPWVYSPTLWVFENFLVGMDWSLDPWPDSNLCYYERLISFFAVTDVPSEFWCTEPVLTLNSYLVTELWFEVFVFYFLYCKYELTDLLSYSAFIKKLTSIQAVSILSRLSMTFLIIYLWLSAHFDLCKTVPLGSWSTERVWAWARLKNFERYSSGSFSLLTEAAYWDTDWLYVLNLV